MPIQPPRGNGLHWYNLLIQNIKANLWLRAESVPQHNRRVGGGFLAAGHGRTGGLFRLSVQAANAAQ